MKRIPRLVELIFSDDLQKMRPYAPLLTRLSVGAVFLQSGMGKISHLAATTEFFASLNIPAPHFHAVFVGWTELIGGVCLLLGLLSRVACVPLMVTMVVATWTSAISDVTGLLEFFALDEVLLFSALGWLLIAGPGRWSFDHWIHDALRGPQSLLASPRLPTH